MNKIAQETKFCHKYCSVLAHRIIAIYEYYFFYLNFINHPPFSLLWFSILKSQWLLPFSQLVFHHLSFLLISWIPQNFMLGFSFFFVIQAGIWGFWDLIYRQRKKLWFGVAGKRETKGSHQQGKIFSHSSSQFTINGESIPFIGKGKGNWD